MRRRQELKRIAASAMAAVMMVTAMPMGGIAYGEEIPWRNITNADDTEVSVASGSNSGYRKSSDSNADVDQNQKDDAGSERKDSGTAGTIKDEETKKKIASWSWNDPEGTLIDGELQLSVTENDQISFADVVSMLPESITAKILDEDESETEEEIAVTEWTCADYTQDAEDLWPTTGEFVFAAEIADEYSLMENVDALDVKVVLADPGAEIQLAETEPYFSMSTTRGAFDHFFPTETPKTAANGKITYQASGDVYTITLNELTESDGISTLGFDWPEGKWELILNGNNTLVGYSSYVTNQWGIAVEYGCQMSISGSGSLDIKAGKYGIFVDVGTMTIESGTINAYGGEKGIFAQKNGKIEIEGGNISTTQSDGTSPSLGVDLVGKMFISDGTFTVNNGMLQSTSGDEGSGELNIFGGRMTVNGEWKLEGANATISGGTVEANNDVKVLSDAGFAGTLTLKNGGKFVLNGALHESKSDISNATTGKFVYEEGGTLTGEGSLDNKLKITITKTDYDHWKGTVGEPFDASQYFEFSPKDQCGTITYGLTDLTDTNNSKETNTTGIFVPKEVGSHRVDVNITGNGFYSSNFSYNYLDVEGRAQSGVSVKAYSGQYDGNDHDAVIVSNQPEGTTIKYRKQGESYQDSCPKVRNCADSGSVYEVEISSGNYKTQTYTTGKVSITPAALSSATVILETPSVVYNGNSQVPTVHAVFGTDSVEIPKAFYTVSYKKDNKTVDEPTDAGTYTVVLIATNVADNNFTGTNESQTFTITQKALTPVLTGKLTRPYNGMIDAEDVAQIVLKDGDQEVSTVTASADSILYDSADAGKRTITATGIKITGGKDQDNYTLETTTASAEGTITNAKMENVYVEQAGDLFYNGKPQSAITRTNADIQYSTGEDPVFTYLDPKDGEYKTSVPAFTNTGNYEVTFKASLKNYDDEYGRLHIRILPGDLSGAQITLTPEQTVYNGNEQTPKVEVKLGDVVLPADDYEVLIRQGDKPVTPQAVGTYTVVVGGKNNLLGSWTQATFTIIEKSIASDDVTIHLSNTEFIYNGEIQQPDVTVTDNMRNAELILGTDYTVNIPETVNAADNYKITVTGIGNYSGTKEVYYQIKQADLSNAEIEISGEYIYNGKGQIPDMDHVRVTIGDLEVPSNAYMTVCSSNVTAGSGAELEIRANAWGDGANYTGSKTANFEIKPAKLTISDVVLKNKVYDGTETAEVESVTFEGLAENDTLGLDDCTNVSAKFTDVNAGSGKQAEVSLELKAGESTKNYELPNGTFLLTGQTINKVAAPVLDDIKVSYSFGATGTKTVDITGLPNDIGTYFGAAAEVSSDAIHALGNSVTVDGAKVTFELIGNKKENIGKTSEILVKNIETQNYEDAELKILVTMDPKKDQGAVSSKMTFTPNSDDETFTAEIAAVDGAEYSFDGETWSDENQKVDCFADTSYTGYIRMKETEELYAGPETAVTAVSPKAYVKTPMITPNGGSFWSKQEIAIESATKDAKIYYTLDGTDPTAASSLYAGPFEISEKATVKAIAVKEHLENSETASAEFIRNYSSGDSDDYEPETGKGTSGSGNTAGTAGSSDNGTITKDDVKGAVSSVNGVITGATNSTDNDGYSHWMKDEKGWWLRYSDGSYPKGTKNSRTSGTSYGWEQINGAWWAFDENGYMKSGWMLDSAFGGWFYMDQDHGMKTGWICIDGKWYYLNPVSDGRRGIMYAGMKTPDGWYVGEDGSWDGLAKQ